MSHDVLNKIFKKKNTIRKKGWIRTLILNLCLIKLMIKFKTMRFINQTDTVSQKLSVLSNSISYDTINYNELKL